MKEVRSKREVAIDSVNKMIQTLTNIKWELEHGKNPSFAAVVAEKVDAGTQVMPTAFCDRVTLVDLCKSVSITFTDALRSALLDLGAVKPTTKPNSKLN